MIGVLKLADGTFVNAVSFREIPAEQANRADCMVFPCNGTAADFNRALCELYSGLVVRIDEDTIKAACERVSANRAAA